MNKFNYYGIMVRNNGIFYNGVDFELYGLGEANIVYEAETENHFTRFMGIFNSKTNNCKRVGLIRSTRPHFIQWIMEYQNSFLLHCGGSPEALKFLEQNENNPQLVSYNVFFQKTTDFEVMNFLFEKKYHFGREHQSKMIHFNKQVGRDGALRLTTNISSLNSVLNHINIGKRPLLTNTVPKFDMSKERSRLCKGALIKYNPKYSVQWTFNKLKKQYLRYHFFNLKSRKIRHNTKLWAKTIIIQYVKTKRGANCQHNQQKSADGRNLRLLYHKNQKYCHHNLIQTVGNGRTLILKDGKVSNGRWIKRNFATRTQWFNSKLQEINFGEENVWIQVVNHPTNLIKLILK